jgi:myo-inositol-1(or 4)-monophosphatase
MWNEYKPTRIFIVRRFTPPTPDCRFIILGNEVKGWSEERRMKSDAFDPSIVDQLPAIEAVAVDLAALAGRQIMAAFGTIFTVRYKTGIDDAASLRDPVSEIDRSVESALREQLARRFPHHGIIGEELAEQPAHDSGFVWAIDPIDGTTNFVNGFPLFAASIGVLHEGRPVVGAVWCSISHALRTGVYHARACGRLQFDGADVTPKLNAAVLRRLAGVPIVANAEETGWEMRTTGSAALECALVAAGLLEVASFSAPNLWDVAGGVALVNAGGGKVIEHADRGWAALETFAPQSRNSETPHLRFWRRKIIIGRPEAVSRMVGDTRI